VTPALHLDQRQQIQGIRLLRVGLEDGPIGASGGLHVACAVKCQRSVEALLKIRRQRHHPR
jgi:hypothetical protein